jgi:hypothetical protein
MVYEFKKSGTLRNVVEVQVNFRPFGGSHLIVRQWVNKHFLLMNFHLKTTVAVKGTVDLFSVKWSSVQNYLRSSYSLSNFISQTIRSTGKIFRQNEFFDNCSQLLFWLNAHSVK